MPFNKFSPLLYFLGAFVLALGVKYFFNDQPRIQKVSLIPAVDGKNIEESLPERISYNFDVKPILSDKCYTCHGPDPKSVQGELRLDIVDHWDRVSEEDSNKQIIFPGDVSKSELVDRINSTRASHLMPPPESNLELTEREKIILEKWIEQGAEWDRHWAYNPPVKKEPRANNKDGWSTHIIDRFFVQQMDKKGLSPAPIAPKEILLRRLYFDLIGLPPSISEIDAFLNDESEDSFEKVVDHLLQSSSYGERRAWIWMDIARYADADGY